MSKRANGTFCGRPRVRGMAIVMALAGCATAPKVAVVVPAGQGAIVAASTRATALHNNDSFSSPELGFELDKPAGNAWAVATNVVSPEGRPIPVVVAHPQSGAQIVIQVSDPVDTPKTLATMLRQKLQAERALNLGQPVKLQMNAAGEDAYGFEFALKGEANGRVAVIAVGDEIVLVVASWPENADRQIVHDIDGVVRSVRAPAGTAAHASIRPDKA